jgi:hypothetical protein
VGYLIISDPYFMASTASLCAKVCNLCPLPTEVYSYTLAMERHNVF